MNNCVFCDIIDGRAPASFVYRDDLCCAFMDIRPINPGHLLVIPLEHSSSLAELPEETGAHLFTTAQRVSRALRKSGVQCEGVNVYMADGAAAGQDVFHVHLHVLPRYTGDGMIIQFGPHALNQPAREELEETAGRIRDNL